MNLEHESLKRDLLVSSYGCRRSEKTNTVYSLLNVESGAEKVNKVFYCQYFSSQPTRMTRICLMAF